MGVGLFPVQIPMIKPGEECVGVILQSIKENHHDVADNDVIVIASKVVSTSLNLIANLDEVKPSERSVSIAKSNNFDPSYAKIIEVITQEGDAEYGGIAYQKEKFLVMWNRKNKALSINAGVDRKNSPIGTVSLEIRDPHKVAGEIRKEVFKRTGKRVGILIIDSNWFPLRNGAIGFTIGLSGFNPVRDCTKDEKGNPATDIYGRPVPIARHNQADDLAAAAHLLMGEGGERVAVVLVKGAPLQFEDNPAVETLYMKEEEDPFFLVFTPKSKIVSRPQWRGQS